MVSRPLLSLVMIVKNEARGIRDTLLSAKQWVDSWLVLDTGSTDGTQQIVRETMDGAPGQLVEEGFVDFGKTRSRALDLAGKESVFTLMLSGDETLVNGNALRAFCQQHADEQGCEHDAYYVRISFGTTVYDSARLARSSAEWRYEGVTHEVLTREGSPPPSIRVPDAYVLHDLQHRDAAGQKRRWSQDLELLSAEARQKPKDTRTAFYLAQTLECLGRYAKAFAAYDKRVRLGGWEEEVYESMFRKARVADALGRSWSDVQQLYLDAHSHSPHRAEPLYAIAWHWYQKQNWPLTYLFASRGAALPLPERATLFVDREVYDHKLLDLVGTSAFYVNELKSGREALAKALERLPEDPRLLRNLSFYEGSPSVEDALTGTPETR